MGIVETELARFELEEIESCCIEYNANGIIHLHLDHLRIEMSPTEFEDFARVVRRARDKLHGLKSENEA